MAGIFRRLFKIGQSEAHATLDKFEDPVKLTEQGIRDLKKDLENSLQSLAEVKALAIRAKREAKEKKDASSVKHASMTMIWPARWLTKKSAAKKKTKSNNAEKMFVLQSAGKK